MIRRLKGKSVKEYTATARPTKCLGIKRHSKEASPGSSGREASFKNSGAVISAIDAAKGSATGSYPVFLRPLNLAVMRLYSCTSSSMACGVTSSFISFRFSTH